MAKKYKTFKTPNSEWTNGNLQTEVLEFIKYIKTVEQKNNLQLLPIDDPNKLGVIYTGHDGEVAIGFFDKTRTTSFFDVQEKAITHQNNIVGEDCMYYPEFVGRAICPTWIPGQKNGGTMNIETYIERLGRAGLW